MLCYAIHLCLNSIVTLDNVILMWDVMKLGTVAYMSEAHAIRFHCASQLTIVNQNSFVKLRVSLQHDLLL